MLQAPSGALAHWADLLTRDERERAARFRDADDASRFAAGRVLSRLAAAWALGRGPSAVTFATAPGGKPWVREAPEIDLSVAHSGPIVLVAIAWRRRIGVDVEVRGRTPGPSALEHVLTHSEQKALGAMAERGDGRWAEAWSRAWCRKEAAGKAWGVGWAGPMDRVEVGIDARRRRVVRPAVLGFPELVCVDLALGPGYVGAACWSRSHRESVLARGPWPRGEST
jgi:4'-phosphopantetheinyl transferase